MSSTVEQTYPLPPGRFPLRKAFNELRSRWAAIDQVAQGHFSDMAECSFASTPLVTHGAWRGHTFASASMHHFFKQHVNPFFEDLTLIAQPSGAHRARTRGRKSKRTAYISNMLLRLKDLTQSMSEGHDESLRLVPEWSAVLAARPVG
jgi:hypothetical protein